MDKKLFFLTFLLLLITALPVKAADLEMQCAASGCEMCDLIKLLTGASKFILGLTGSLALLFFVIGGLMFLISGGNSSAVESGRKMLLSAVIGLAIVFFAWAGVNFTILTLTGNLKSESKVAQLFGKPWNQLECVKPLPPPPPTTTQPAGAEPAAGYCHGIAMSSGAGNTCSDVSPSLITLLNCIRDYNKQNLPLTITSISSSQYGLGSGCEITHSKNSCHCQPNGSMAADFRNKDYSSDQRSDFEGLINGCRGTLLKESDHYHVQTPDCRQNY